MVSTLSLFRFFASDELSCDDVAFGSVLFGSVGVSKRGHGLVELLFVCSVSPGNSESGFFCPVEVFEVVVFCEFCVVFEVSESDVEFVGFVLVFLNIVLFVLRYLPRLAARRGFCEIGTIASITVVCYNTIMTLETTPTFRIAKTPFELTLRVSQTLSLLDLHCLADIDLIETYLSDPVSQVSINNLYEMIIQGVDNFNWNSVSTSEAVMILKCAHETIADLGTFSETHSNCGKLVSNNF